MDTKRVGIIRGGESGYEYSFKKGGDMILHIFDNLSHKYKPVDILIDKSGAWHVSGLPIDSTNINSKVDVVWNMTHPNSPTSITHLSMPKICTGPFSSALKNSKEMLASHMKKIGVKIPRHMVLPAYQEDFDGEKDKYAMNKAREVFSKFSSPWVVKSFIHDPDMGVHVAKTFEELVSAIKDGIDHKESILIEEFISGKNVIAHSVSGFRGESVYVFPPQGINDEEKERLITLVKALHDHVSAENYLKSDFVYHPKRGFFLSGIDFDPDVRIGSHFAQSCEYVGAKMHHIIEHILDKGLGGK